MIVLKPKQRNCDKCGTVCLNRHHIISLDSQVYPKWQVLCSGCLSGWQKSHYYWSQHFTSKLLPDAPDKCIHYEDYKGRIGINKNGLKYQVIGCRDEDGISYWKVEKIKDSIMDDEFVAWLPCKMCEILDGTYEP